MKCDFSFKHLDTSQALMDYAQEKLQNVASLMLKEGRAHIEFSRNKKFDYICEVTIQSGIGHFKALAHGDSFHHAVELCNEKLYKQIMKNRKINQKHKGPERSKRGRLEEINKNLEQEQIDWLPVGKNVA